LDYRKTNPNKNSVGSNTTLIYGLLFIYCSLRKSKQI